MLARQHVGEGAVGDEGDLLPVGVMDGEDRLALARLLAQDVGQEATAIGFT